MARAARVWARGCAVLVGIASCCLAPAARGAFFSGNAFFSQAPVSQLGPIVFNNLVINNGPFSITVSGQIKVQVPPGLATGTLIEWTVDRPLDPSYGTSSMNTTMTLNGFSTPPSGGTYGNTLGKTFTFLDQYPVQSNSQFNLALTNGAAVWPQNTVYSSVFTYTSASGNHYLRQRWELDGVQFSGPGGIWLIDLPLTSEVVDLTLPEPGGLGMVIVGMGLLGRRRGCSWARGQRH